QPSGVAVDRFGNIFVADTQNSTIRRGTPLALSIQSIPATYQVAISWPLVATGFVLETSASLFPTAWTPLSNGILISGENYVLTTNVLFPTSFYRLRRSE